MPVVSIVELGQQPDPSAADGTSPNSNRIFLVTNHTVHGSPHQWVEIPSMPLEQMDEVR